MTIKSNWYKTFALIHVFILQTFPLLVTFNVFEIRKNLDLRKILSTPKIFLKSRFHCNKKWFFHYFIIQNYKCCDFVRLDWKIPNKTHITEYYQNIFLRELVSAAILETQYTNAQCKKEIWIGNYFK